MVQRRKYRRTCADDPARSPAPHSIHAPAARIPHQTDPPQDQLPLPNSPAIRRATSAQSSRVSPEPASKAAAEAKARAPSPIIRGFFFHCGFAAQPAFLRCLFLRFLLCDSPVYSVSLRYLFFPSRSILQHPSRRSLAASCAFFPLCSLGSR